MAEIGTSSASSGAAAGIEPGDVVAEKYRVERVLGAGGMGVVFMARHIELDDAVALKVLARELLDNADAVTRFRREAQAAAKLKHEHVVRVFDVGVHRNSQPYLVMEYLEGGDLARVIRDAGALGVEQAADLVIQACSAVGAAHRLGIIHRDLKPSNLFCVPRADGWFNVKVVDFGISRVNAGPSVDERGITVTGNVVGSPSYMSPEQMRASHRVDPRTDIWSLGVVLYECLTGKLPFPATTYAEVCIKVTQDPPEPLAGHVAALPPALSAVVLRCLEKDRERRFGSAEELALALAEFALPSARQLAVSRAFSGARATGETPPRASSAPPVTSSLTFNRRSFTRTAHGTRSRPPPWLAASLGVGGILVVGAWFALARGTHAPEPRNANVLDGHAASVPPAVAAPVLEASPRSTSTEPAVPAPVTPSASAVTVPDTPSGSAVTAPSPPQPRVASAPTTSASSRAPAPKPPTERNSSSRTWQR